MDVWLQCKLYSHLVSVPAGTVLLSDMIVSSPMLSEDGVTAPAAGGGGGPGDDGEFGVDPNLDPELAMVNASALDFAIHYRSG